MKGLIRWTTILISGGFGIYTLVACLWGMVVGFDGNWGGALFVLSFTLISSGVPLVISFLVLRREYQALCVMFAAIGAVIVFFVLFSLPHKLGLDELYLPAATRSPWRTIIGLPLLLFSFLIPFYASRFFFRFFLRLIERHFDEDSTAAPVA